MWSELGQGAIRFSRPLRERCGGRSNGIDRTRWVCWAVPGVTFSESLSLWGSGLEWPKVLCVHLEGGSEAAAISLRRWSWSSMVTDGHPSASESWVGHVLHYIQLILLSGLSDQEWPQDLGIDPQKQQCSRLSPWFSLPGPLQWLAELGLLNFPISSSLPTCTRWTG